MNTDYEPGGLAGATRAALSVARELAEAGPVHDEQLHAALAAKHPEISAAARDAATRRLRGLEADESQQEAELVRRGDPAAEIDQDERQIEQ